MGIINRTPVIRIDQAKIPELCALIRIGDPRGGDLHEGLGQRVKQAQVTQAPLQAQEIVEKRRVLLGIEDLGHIVRTASS